MERNLLKFIWQNSRLKQIWLLVVIIASMPLYFITLELPKQIVNGPIQGDGFSGAGATQPFLRLPLPFAEQLFGREIILFDGFQFDRLTMLFALGFLFLAAVIANGWFKLYMNTYKGKLGESLLRQLRYTLLDRVLRYRVARFRNLKGAEAASVIKDEVEPLGEFVGDAFSLPIFLGGQAITGLLFLFLQSVYFGLLTIAIVGLQVWLIPRLRRKLIQLGRQRQLQARRLSGQVAETVEMAPDIHVNDMSNFTRARHFGLLSTILNIRFELYQRKFLVKYINNLLMQFLSFLFYVLGGYFVITGRLDIGQLVAVIAAYKDLPGPIKGLIDYDQLRLINEARYEQTVDSFRDDGLLPTSVQDMAGKPVAPLKDGFQIDRATLEDETGRVVLENLSMRIAPSERVAIVTHGDDAARTAANVLCAALARLTSPLAGTIALDGTSLDNLPESVTGRRVAYVDANSFFPAGTIRDNLTMVLKNQPVGLDVETHGIGKVKNGMLQGEPPGEDLDWIDLATLGIADGDAFARHVREVLEISGLSLQIQDLGLRGTVDPEANPAFCDKIVEVRREFRDNAASFGVEGIVEPFHPDRYNDQATVGENLLFGTARMPAWEPDGLPTNPVLLSILDRHELRGRLQDMGMRIAEARIELFGDLAPDSKIFETVADVTFEEVARLKEMMARLRMAGRQTPEGAASRGAAKKDKALTDKEELLRIAFGYCEAQSRFGVVDEEIKAAVLAARANVREVVAEMEAAPVFFHDPDRYNPTATVLDNILLGRISSSVVDGKERVLAAVQELISRTGISNGLLDAGLDFEMGNGGRRLSEMQRQKLRVARALIKKPDIIIFNEVLGAMDAAGRRDIMNRILDRPLLSDEDWNPGLVAVLLDDELAARFDRTIIYRNATLREEAVETGQDAAESAAPAGDTEGAKDNAHAK
ncbi:ABC transporter ATP-binding protein [Nitratireductor mangrovi]|uniref:ABC transporter ATP-binding protein n=1 Tax=Nitratireductor mangrovi TaxID=2599600 RepID=A0A5B8KYA3_9HYPH|nr:ABC transporter transmembrane domain-containing protein [Nitratireductor mangrovi]QDZ00593.1 ABC transporter ATP-binding protein [Nitratireductor mangrovi]